MELPHLQPGLLGRKLQVIAVKPPAAVLSDGAGWMRRCPLGRSRRTSGIFPEREAALSAAEEFKAIPGLYRRNLREYDPRQPFFLHLPQHRGFLGIHSINADFPRSLLCNPDHS
ncbi:hypothetical protein D3C73_1190860 [compost metagenome]